MIPLPFRDSIAAHEPLLECGYFRAGLCRSCTLIEMPQDEQLAWKNAFAQEKVRAFEWLEPVAGEREAFRNKVKLVVSGSVSEPRLGIFGPDGEGVDLADCPLPTPGIRSAIPVLREFVRVAELEPYRPASDTGTLKYIIVSESPDGELLVRFVAKRRGVQGVLFKRRAELEAILPNLRVLTLNVQPEHKAILEGDDEIVISDTRELSMRVWLNNAQTEVDLHLLPKSFFQTSTDGAEALYSRAANWLTEVTSVWDLYSGVGGFALSLAVSAKEAGREVNVIGVETTPEAAESAQLGAEKLGISATFIAADACTWAREQDGQLPDAIVVNPPRRGIGAQLATWLEESGVERVVYSSCNIETLATDLEYMRSFDVTKAQVVDMFPHTRHFETIAFLKRR